MRLPDLKNSRAVLVGAAQYDHLEQLPAVVNNLRELRDLFVAPDILGISPEHCVVIPDPREPRDIIDPLKATADAATDTLIVYYAGHGLLDDEGDLHLALTGARVDAADYTATAYKYVRKRIAESKALRKVVILDCCYAARAFMGQPITSFTEKTAIYGTYVLAAVAENRLALAHPGETHTAFTGEFIKLLAEGSADGPEFLGMEYIYQTLHDILASRNLPVPQAQDRNQTSSLTLFRNVSYQPADSVTTDPGKPSDDFQIPVQRSDAERRAHNTCISSSEPFLRRNKLPNHHSVYVPRSVDRDIVNAIREVSPRRLERLTKMMPERAGDSGAVQLRRESPPQVAIILDPPGSGKTMLATQLILRSDSFLCVARTADAPDVHELRRQLERLGKDDFGLGLLREIDKPFVYIIDGLDESDTPEKRADIVHLLRSLADLNRSATAQGLLSFPAFVMLTARKDAWERWVSVFEGRKPIRLRDHLAKFSDKELGQALSSYYNAYQYSFAAPLPEAAQDILSTPFNLSVLSEALEYGGDDIPAEQILDKHPLTYYFDWLGPRAAQQLASLTNKSFRDCLCDLAFTAAQAPQGHIEEANAVGLLSDHFAGSPDLADDFLEILVQARVVIRELDRYRRLRFRYVPVVEYLLALRVVMSPGADQLESVTVVASESGQVSAAAVKHNVLTLARATSSGLADTIENYYTTSPTYISGEVSHLRVSFGSGAATSSADIQAIRNTIGQMPPETAFDAFFVIAAKPNDQPAGRILEAFDKVWELNAGRWDRWKMLEKAADRGLLTDVRVIEKISQSQVPREWEVFLGRLHERDDSQLVARHLERSFLAVASESPAWDQARGLLELAVRGLPFIPGTVFDRPPGT